MFYLQRHHDMKIKVSSELSIVRLIIALALACISTVWAIKINNFGLSESSIGFISAILSLSSIITAFSITPLLEKFNENKILTITMIFQGIVFILMGVFDVLWIFIVASIGYYILGRIRRTTFSIVFKDNVSEKELNRSEAFMYVLVNVGWLVGPLIAGLFLREYGVNSVFFFGGSFLWLATALYVLLHTKEIKKERETIDFDVKKNIIEFWKNKKLRLSFLISAGISGWWAFVYLYPPIFILKAGLNQIYVSYFLTALVIPLVLFEYTIGKISEKEGFRKFFLIGFGGLTVLCSILFFIDNMFFVILGIIVGSIFLSTLEPLKETFFFKHVKSKDEEKFFPIYSSAMNIGEIATRIIIAIVLIALPNNFAYLTMAILMGTIFIVMLLKEDE